MRVIKYAEKIYALADELGIPRGSIHWHHAETTLQARAERDEWERDAGEFQAQLGHMQAERDAAIIERDEWTQKYDEVLNIALGYIKHLHAAEAERDAALARVRELEYCAQRDSADWQMDVRAKLAANARIAALEAENAEPYESIHTRLLQTQRIAENERLRMALEEFEKEHEGWEARAYGVRAHDAIKFAARLRAALKGEDE